MLDPRLLYSFNPSLWEDLRGRRPVLVHLFDGYVDAGRVGQTVSEHILATCESEILVEFDHDQLHDYRSRRPTMVFDTDQWKSSEQFLLAMHRVIAPTGEHFVLFTGPEPDTQWERATAAVTGLVERLDVRLAVSTQGIPTGVPHTRPSLITEYATRPDLIKTHNPAWVGRIEVPGSFGSYLELHLGRIGVDALGLAVNVPHYLSQAPFFQATVAALHRLNDATGLNLPLGDLAGKAETNLNEIATEVATSTEVQEVVAQLERQYDQARASKPVPTADEIGAELERFLAEQNDKDDGGKEER
ncbi:MAG: PAC2 family protein [Propionibacteriaceae bacterium]|nr:PAC2 family protein [Propionibacteriaceae bacterium]